jgi:hypothetical protein
VTGANLSVVDKLLLAALSLERDGMTTFTAEDLVMAAWRSYPDTFGLRGHLDEAGKPAHPDSNRVFAEIMGSKPIRRRGLLVKVGNKLYRLTEAGREQARLLDTGTATPTAERSRLDRKLEAELRRILTSRAVGKYGEGRLEEITFYDACQLWGISPRSSAMDLEARLAHFRSLLAAATAATGGRTISFAHGGDVFSSEDFKRVLSVHNELLARFEAEIQTIRRRTDERAT